MELLYVWIEDYKNIKKQGFNFSPKHWFDFEHEEKDGKVIGGELIHRERKTNYPKDFFGENISNVTAIVGKNGSGKTNIIDVISEIRADTYSKFAFSIWSEASKTKISYYSTKEIRSNIDLQRSNGELNLSHIYYTGVLQYLNLEEKRTTDLSVYGKLININLNSNNNDEIRRIQKGTFRTIYNEYLYKEITNQVTFLSNASNIVQNSLEDRLYIPERLEIKLRTLAGVYYRKGYDFSCYDKNINSQIIYGFYISIALWLFRSFDTQGIITTKEIVDSYNQNEGAVKSLDILVKNYTVDEKDYSASKKALENINALLLSEKYSFGGSYKDDTKDIRYRDKFYISIKNKEVGNIIDFVNELRSRLGSLQELVSFQWEGLSYGQNEVLKLGSSIFSILQHRKGDELCPVLLTIDEGELGFHAEWQKKYLSLVLNLLTKLFPRIPFQIIMTSHSPFLVSELPKENIIFLDKGKETGNCKVCQPENMSSTFGANIHSLYRNSFFLENGLMGEFAKRKIDQVIRNLNNETINDNDKIRPEDIQFVIQQIGEPLIKDKLQRMYDDHPDFGLDENIEKLQLKLNELKFKKNGSNTNS